MEEWQKLDLARQLASSFGMEGRPKSEPSSFDSTTGTLFVGSRIYRQEDLMRAKRFFRENKKKMHSLGDGASSLYEIGEIAVENLLSLCNENGGRVVIRN